MVPLENSESWYNIAVSAVTARQQNNSFDCGVVRVGSSTSVGGVGVLSPTC